ncbi:MAG: hypothetical protein ACRBK7_19450 [Acidimicrobiales bacterium]
MSYDPATTGEAPISWGQAPPPPDEGKSARSQSEASRLLGFGATDIGMASWLPDEPEALTAALLEDGRPFNGAFVPLVVHDSLLAERSFDAAEWAADLIRGEGGECLCITPFAERERIGETPLSRRQWNHTAAMIERLDDLCKRYKLRPLVSDTIGDQQAREHGGLDPDLPIHFVLDAGSFLPDGFVPARLISPQQVELDGNPLTDKLRGFLRNRG